MSFNSPSDNHETKHDPNHPAGTPQSPETGGDIQRVPANRPEGAPRPYRESDYIGEVDFIGLREISFARACRSRSAVLCASTDADDALACAVYAARIRANVSACLASFYPRADPRRIREIIDRAENPS